MLNLTALYDAHAEYQKTLIDQAEACSKEIKILTEKFTEMNIPDVFYTWEETGVVVFNGEPVEQEMLTGIAWDSSTKKIMFFVDCPDDATVLAGEKAHIRAQIRPMLQTLVNKGVKALQAMKEGIEPKPITQVMKEYVAVNRVIKAQEALEDVLNHPVSKELDEDDYVWKEGPNGEPSYGDQMLTNGIED